MTAERGAPAPRRAGDKTQADADRKASGRVAVKVWLTAEEAAALETRVARSGRTKRDVIGALLLETARR